MKEYNIFVFRVGSIGDSIVALPAIRKICRYYNKKLHFITNKPSRGVFSAWGIYSFTDYFEDKFEFDFSIKDILALKEYINSKKGKKILFYFVDESSFERNFRNYLFFKLLGFDEVYGWRECIGEYIKKDKNGKLLEVEPEYVRLEKIVDKYLNLKTNTTYEYNFFKYDKKFIEECKQKFDFLSERFIVLGVGGKTKIQRWNIENYIYVLNQIKTDFKVVVLGSKEESKEAKIIKNSLNKEVINLCGNTSILESSYILKDSICYFGNDTGTAHLAGISGTNVLVVASARNNPNRWLAYGKSIMYQKRLECEGCFLSNELECQYNLKCLKEINKKFILLKLKELLNESK